MTQALPLDNASLKPVTRAAGAPSNSAGLPAPAAAVTLLQVGADIGAADHQSVLDASPERMNIGPLKEVNTAIKTISASDPLSTTAEDAETAYLG